MSRLLPADEAEWLAFHFPERARAPVPAAPAVAAVDDWAHFHFPLRKAAFPLEGEAPENAGGAGGEAGGEAGGDGGVASGGGGGRTGGTRLHPPTAMRDPTPFPAEWYFDHSGARLVNWRLQRSLPLTALDNVERVRRLIEADGRRGRAGDLWAALREAALACLGQPLDEVLEQGGTIAWGATPGRRRAGRRPAA